MDVSPPESFADFWSNSHGVFPFPGIGAIGA